MQDKQILGLLEKYSKLTDNKQLYNQSTEILKRLTINDQDFIIDKVMNGLQSTDPQIQSNFALLLSEFLLHFKDIPTSKIFDMLQVKLSKKQSLGKSEFRHFLVAKYMVYSYLDAPKLLQTILSDKDTDDSEYLFHILIKQIKQDNIKLIVQQVKNDLQNMKPKLFALLVALQQADKKGQFPWEKLVQEQVFDRKKLESLITTSIDAYPKKQLFYKYLMKYMSKYQNHKESLAMFQEFWEFILGLEVKKSNYLVLQLLKHFLKNTEIPISNILFPQLIEVWHRSFGSSNPQVKKLAAKVEKYLIKREISFETICFLRGVYGYRLHPKNIFASTMFSKFSDEESLKYFKIMRKHLNQQTDPIKKLYFLNEIYVFAISNFENIKNTYFQKILYFIYEKGCINLEGLYESLDDESKEAYKMEEVKKKFEDQCQTFFFSLIAKAATDKNLFNEIVPALIEQCKKIESEKFEQLSLIHESIQSDNVQLQHLCNGVILFSFIHFEEGIQILSELQNVVKDLKSGVEPKLKKKVKNNSGKAKVVLTEVFIQLLTKSPQYLRDAVNECFKSIEFGEECFDILLEVLVKNDDEYILDMAQQEIGEVEDGEEEDEEIDV